MVFYLVVTLECIDGKWVIVADDSGVRIWQSDGRPSVAGCPPLGAYTMNAIGIDPTYCGDDVMILELS
jgi:hypothetical protein